MSQKNQRVADKETSVEKVAAAQEKDFAQGVRSERPRDAKDDRKKEKETSLDEKHEGLGGFSLTSRRSCFRQEFPRESAGEDLCPPGIEMLCVHPVRLVVEWSITNHVVVGEKRTPGGGVGS